MTSGHWASGSPQGRVRHTVTAPKQVPLAAGKVTRLRPADWSNVGSSPLQVEVRDTVDGPPVQCFEL